MVAKLKVLVPEATTNYVFNPSFRYSTTEWTAVGATLTRVLTYKLFGIASMKIVTAGLVINEGAYYRANNITPAIVPILDSTQLTASIYARGAGRVRVRLSIYGEGDWSSEGVSLSANRWKRIEVTGSYHVYTDDVRLYIETDNVADATTFYVDGAQIEKKAYATSYCDGDQPGCRWNIMDSFSNSTRGDDTREGGRWVQLSGRCGDDDIYVTVLGGFGMPPLQHNIQSWAQSAGSYFQNTKVLNRSVTILFNVKNENKRIVTDVNASPLHEMRQQLIDIFKSDLTGGSEAFWFSYQTGERELYIRMRYEAGLEGDWDIRNQWINSFPVRFLVVDPYFVELNAHAQSLAFKDPDVTSVANIVGRIGGDWNNISGGLDDEVYRVEKGQYGELLAAGAFILSGTNVNLSRTGFWDGATWESQGGANGYVKDFAMAPNGDIYATGSFTNIGGVAANYVARYDHWLGIWNAMGTGLDNVGYVIFVSPDADVYVGGPFHQAGGINVYHIARWDGSSWHSIGTGPGVDDYVGGIASNSQGTKIYLAGPFVKNYGSGTDDLNRIGVWDKATNVISALGSGFNGRANSVNVSPTGVIYACGGFTASGTTTLHLAAKWNGSSWIPLGSELHGTELWYLEIVTDSEIYGVGDFTLDTIAGARDCSVALWNGSVWVNPGIELHGTSKAFTARMIGEDLYIGGDIPSTEGVSCSVVNDVMNYGTAEVFPIIYIYGPGHIVWIENRSIQKRVYMDLWLLDNEELFIDFGQRKVYSSMRGNLLFTVIEGSDLGDFMLRPGNNEISILMTDDVLSSMYIYYQPRHWSADATVDAEALE